MKTMIAVPCMDQMSTSFVASLVQMVRRHPDVKVCFLSDSLVYDARNALAHEAINAGCDRILWLDSDIVFGPDLLDRLSDDMKDDRDVVTALYFRRRIPTSPLILKQLEWYADGPDGPDHIADTYEDFPRDRLFEVAGCGLGACMMKTEVILKVCEKYKQPAFDPLATLGEDYSFCWRLGELGIKIWCDPRIPIGHVGVKVYTQAAWDSQETRSSKDVAK